MGFDGFVVGQSSLIGKILLARRQLTALDQLTKHRMWNPIAWIGQEHTGILNFLEGFGCPHDPLEIDLRCLCRVASLEMADEYSALQAGNPRLDGHLSLPLGKRGLNIWQSHSTTLAA